MWMQIAAVAAGAFDGGVLRAWTSAKLNRSDWHIPYGTLMVNLVGSFVIGLMIGLTARALVPPDVRALVMTGLCGGLTTFSTFTSETAALFDEGRDGHAWLYWVGSMALGLLCAWLGMLLARQGM